MDINSVVRFVDDYRDKDPKTVDSCPGKVYGNQLVRIGVQIERRIFGLRKSVKHIIFVEEGTRNIWYKNTFCYPSVVAMGFSASKLIFHPKAVSMQEYAKYFLDQVDTDWLKRNDFVLD